VSLLLKIEIPYGSGRLTIRIPERNLMGILEPKILPGVSDPRIEIKNALENPLNSKKISEIASSGDKVAIVVDDITRPLPTKILLPPILDELINAGVHKRDIVIIIGTGTHRPITKEEAEIILGREIANSYAWINHNCDAKDLVHVGRTSYGNDVYINRVYFESDVKIVLGDVMLHYYAGYGGGPKSIVPGIAGRKTIEYNHSLMFHPNARSGVARGNPVFEDIMEGAKLAGWDFAVNVILNTKKEIVKVFAGDLESIFNEAVKIVDSMYKVPIDEKADIVVASTGGFPFDINFYQAHKGLYNAEFATKEGGTIILSAECRDGIGHNIFQEWMLKYKNADQVIKTLKKEFVLGGHKAYYIMRSISRYHVYLYSNLPEHIVTNVLRLKHADDINKILIREINKKLNARVLLMPFATETLPIIRGN